MKRKRRKRTILKEILKEFKEHWTVRVKNWRLYEDDILLKNQEIDNQHSRIHDIQITLDKNLKRK
jgi:hypothetical protein